MKTFVEFLNYCAVTFFNCLNNENYTQAFLLFLFLVVSIVLIITVCITIGVYLYSFFKDLCKIYIKPLKRFVRSILNRCSGE